MTTVIRDDDSRNIYAVPVGRCNELTSVDEYKHEEKCQNSLIFPGESISKKEPSKILENTTMCLYIAPGTPTLFYQKRISEFKYFIVLGISFALYG